MLEEQIRSDLTNALKNHESEKVATLRFLLSATQNVFIEKRQPLTDDDVLSVIQKQIKSRNDSVEMYVKGSRQDLADKEMQEIAIIQKYLPTQLTDEEILELVKQSISETHAESRKDMGAVMAKLGPEIAGKADKGKVAQIVGKLLDHGQ